MSGVSVEETCTRQFLDLRKGLLFLCEKFLKYGVIFKSTVFLKYSNFLNWGYSNSRYFVVVYESKYVVLTSGGRRTTNSRV